MSKPIEITAWRLAVWAYRAQQVHRAGRGGFSPAGGGRSFTGLAMHSLELGIVSAGGGAGVAPPEDAVTVDVIVGRMAAEIRRDLVSAACIAAMPDWDPRGLGCRFEPELRGNDRPRMVYDPSGKRAIACRVRLVGIEPWRAESIRHDSRRRYARVIEGLTELAIACALPTALKSWRCKGLGIDPTPWAHGSARRRLTNAEKA